MHTKRSAPVYLSLLLSILTTNLPISALGDPVDLELRSFLRSIYYPDEPGVATIVVVDGEILHRDAYGIADLELHVSLKPEMVFQIGSMTKQFTAAAILILEQQGKLSREDSIGRHLPDYPDHGRSITIAQLLTHTSGLYEFTTGRDLTSLQVREELTPTQLVDSFKDHPLSFAPGDQHVYSNSGYVLLGSIIERVSGQTYGDFIENEIFEPLRMTSSHYGGDQIVQNRVSGYRGTAGEYSHARYVSESQPYSAGALLSNVDDLARWDQALRDELLPSVSYETMGRRATLNAGEVADYGYGLRFFDVAGHEAVGHGGWYSGFSGIAFRIPSEGLYIAVLTNNPEKRPNRTQIATTIAEIVLGGIAQ